MARTFGASGMADIRSVSILYDVVYAGMEWNRPKPQFRKDLKTLPLRESHSFDSSQSWLLLICSVALAAIALGILHACAFLGEFGSKDLDLTPGQVALITGAMYGMFLFACPFGGMLVRSWGPRITATAGFLLGFLGLTLMGLEIHMITFLVGSILLGPGTSLVQTAVSCCIVDLFKAQISAALIVLSLASPLGSVIFVAFSYYTGYTALFRYKWIMLTYAMLFIAAIAVTRHLPATLQIPGHQDSIKAVEVSQRIKQCLKSAKAKKQNESVQPPQKLLRNCTCTCVCFVDLGVLKDMTFCVWAIVCFCAMLTFYVPHVIFLAFMKFELGYDYLEGLKFVCAFNGASMISRIAVFMADDFSYLNTRAMFQAGLIGSAIAYFSIHLVETWGWMMAAYAGVGVTEGLFVILIPRMTLHLFPRKYLASVWQLLIPTHGAAVFLGATFMVLSRNVNDGDIFLGCVLVGIVQVIALILSFLLPEDLAKEAKDTKAGLRTGKRRSRQAVAASSPRSSKIQVQSRRKSSTQRSVPGNLKNPGPARVHAGSSKARDIDVEAANRSNSKRGP